MPPTGAPPMTFIADEGEVAPIVELSETLLSPPIRSPLDVFALDGAICKLDAGVMNALPGRELASSEATSIAARSAHTHTSTASATEGRQRRLRRLRRLREQDSGDASAAAVSVGTEEDAVYMVDIEREKADAEGIAAASEAPNDEKRDDRARVESNIAWSEVSDFEEGVFVGSVPYLSPMKLRDGLEEVLSEHRTDAIFQREVLRHRYPELFWNLWWYSARFGLPFPLSEGPDDLTAQWICVCGWDALSTHRAAAIAAHDAVASLAPNLVEEEDAAVCVNDDEMDRANVFDLEGVAQNAPEASGDSVEGAIGNDDMDDMDDLEKIDDEEDEEEGEARKVDDVRGDGKDDCEGIASVLDDLDASSKGLRLRQRQRRQRLLQRGLASSALAKKYHYAPLVVLPTPSIAESISIAHVANVIDYSFPLDADTGKRADASENKDKAVGDGEETLAIASTSQSSMAARSNLPPAIGGISDTWQHPSLPPRRLAHILCAPSDGGGYGEWLRVKLATENNTKATESLSLLEADETAKCLWVFSVRCALELKEEVERALQRLVVLQRRSRKEQQALRDPASESNSSDAIAFGTAASVLGVTGVSQEGVKGDPAVLAAAAATATTNMEKQGNGRCVSEDKMSEDDLKEQEAFEGAIQAALKRLLVRRLGDPVSFKVNIYRCLMRLATVAAATRPSTTLDASLRSISDANAAGGVSEPGVAAVERRHQGNPAPERGGTAVRRLSTTVLPATEAVLQGSAGVESRFDRAYRRAVEHVVFEELLPADRAAAFKSDPGYGRHASDLMPLPNELAFRSVFGHLF